MARRWAMAASLLSCASYLEHFPTHSIVILKLFFLTVLESGAPLGRVTGQNGIGQNGMDKMSRTKW